MAPRLLASWSDHPQLETHTFAANVCLFLKIFADSADHIRIPSEMNSPVSQDDLLEVCGYFVGHTLEDSDLMG